MDRFFNILKIGRLKYKGVAPWGTSPILVGALVLGISLSGCKAKEPSVSFYREKRVMLGTYVEVMSPQKEAPEIVFKEIKRIEDLLSKYVPESEIAKLNKAGELKVSPETLYIIKKSLEFWQASDGAFDITVGPLIDLWGFSTQEYFFPKQEQVTGALALVGSDKIVLNETESVVKFMASGMKIDLGAIAKGFAVDCAVKKLREAGITSCLINAGGQVYCLGRKLNRPWKVAVRSPWQTGTLNTLELKDQAVSTSGNYEQFFIKENKKLSHIFNPKTGFPADSGVVSVTVIASDGLTADALSTAIFVLGREKGQALADKYPGVKAEIVDDKG